MGVTFVQLQKIVAFPIDFNDFIQLGGQVGVTLGILGKLWGHLGSMREAVGHFWVTWAPHWADDVYMCGLGGAEKRTRARH